MKQAHIRALERIFNDDVEQALAKHKLSLPYQSKAKVYEALEADGYVRRVEVKVGSGPFSCTVRGWALTQAGHLAYCMSCADESEDRDHA